MEQVNTAIEKEAEKLEIFHDGKISMNIPPSAKPRLVIIGGGFAGIEMIKAIGKDGPFQIVLIDKHNYHTFQPLLYQVATAGLEPDSIAAPLRKIFNGYNDMYFRLAKVSKLTPETNCVETDIGALTYNFLVIATGTKTNYYGNEQLKRNAFPMKQLNQALDIRSKILQNYERAILTTNPDEKNSLLNIVIVGGGPTGVELAGALAELRRHVLPEDLPEINFKDMKIILIESGPKLLGVMSQNASDKSYQYLKKFGIDIYLNVSVKAFDGYAVSLSDGKTLYSQTVIWAAGVTGSIVDGLRPEAVKGNRYVVDGYGKVDGYTNIYAIGDISSMTSDQFPKGYPMLAQVAMQQGKLLAKNLKAQLQKKPMKLFHYNDKGSMATVGRNKAVADLENFKFSGFFAWIVWMLVHLMFLIGFRNKVTTFINWIWNYLTFDRATRLIVRPWKNKIEDRED